jgi:hypothetical protein
LPYTANSSEKGGKKNRGINPGQPAGKGQKKKLKKQNPGINPGQRLKYTEAGSAIHSEPAGKGRKKKTKKPWY